MDQIPVILSIVASGSTVLVNLYLVRQARKGQGNRKGGKHRR